MNHRGFRVFEFIEQASVQLVYPFQRSSFHIGSRNFAVKSSLRKTATREGIRQSHFESQVC